MICAALLALVACAHPASEPLRRASAAEAMGDLETAAGEAARARAILQRQDQEGSLLVGVVGFQGRLARELERFDEAESHFRVLLEILERERGPEHPTLAYALVELGDLAARSGEDDEARRLYQRVLDLREGGERARADRRAFALAGIARITWDDGDLDAADRLFREAITSGSTTARRFWPIRSDYAALLRTLGDDEGAARVEAPVVTPPWSPRHYARNVLTWTPPLRRNEGMVQRWPDDRMPLRVHVPPPPDGAFAEPERAVETVREAVRSWSDVVRPGVPRFVFVDSRGRADIPFRWVDELPEGRGGEARRRSTSSDELRLNVVRLATHWEGVAVHLSVLASVALHETGHGLGLFGHSPDPGDAMYWRYLRDREATGLSERDRETLRVLYSFEPGQVIALHELP